MWKLWDSSYSLIIVTIDSPGRSALPSQCVLGEDVPQFEDGDEEEEEETAAFAPAAATGRVTASPDS